MRTATQQEMTLAAFELSPQSQLANELFAESVDDLLTQIEFATRGADDVTRSRLQFAARRIEGAVAEAASILATLE